MTRRIANRRHPISQESLAHAPTSSDTQTCVLCGDTHNESDMHARFDSEGGYVCLWCDSEGDA